MGPKSENVKISSAWIRPKWAHKQQTHTFPTYFASPNDALARQESEPKRQRNDRSENMSSKEALSDALRSPKTRLFIKIGLCLYSELCFLHGRGAHFQKSSEKKSTENKKLSQKRLDGKSYGYMKGLDGTEKRNC